MTAYVYPIPKIHKSGNPGRPTVSSNGTFTEKVSRHVDYSHKPLYTRIPLYIWHTDLLNKLQKLPPLPTGSPLVTLDVPSLHTNILHNQGMRAVNSSTQERLNSYQQQTNAT